MWVVLSVSQIAINNSHDLISNFVDTTKDFQLSINETIWSSVVVFILINSFEQLYHRFDF